MTNDVLPMETTEKNEDLVVGNNPVPEVSTGEAEPVQVIDVAGNENILIIKALVKGEYHEKLCDIHRMNYTNHFCCSCRCEPICISCFQIEHQGHNFFQVHRASRDDSVRVADIKKYINTEGISVYSINGHPIVYLNSRTSKNNSSPSSSSKGSSSSAGTSTIDKGKSKPKAKCRICERDLKTHLDRLCSIACKIKEMETSNNVGAASSSGVTEVDRSITQNGEFKRVSFRKRKRKGIPRRAPLM